MIAHMCDSTYVIPKIGAGIRSIEVDSSVLSVVPTRTGVSVHCLWIIVALTTDGNGFRVDTRLEISMAPTVGEAFQIIEIREFDVFHDAVPQGSWGLLKSLFR